MKMNGEIMRIILMIEKYKRSLLIMGFFCGYALFWWWFYHGKNIAITDSAQKQQTASENKIVTEESIEETSASFDDLGNFWIEISTDDVQIKAPIVEGVTDDRLAVGVGHHVTTAFPSKDGGNVVLSGHRWKIGKNPAYTIFEDLDQLQVGDKIHVHYREQDFMYEITETEIVDDDAVEILTQTEESILTVYTCTPKYTAFKRLVYRAQLVE